MKPKVHLYRRVRCLTRVWCLLCLPGGHLLSAYRIRDEPARQRSRKPSEWNPPRTDVPSFGQFRDFGSHDAGNIHLIQHHGVDMPMADPDGTELVRVELQPD